MGFVYAVLIALFLLITILSKISDYFKEIGESQKRASDRRNLVTSRINELVGLFEELEFKIPNDLVRGILNETYKQIIENEKLWTKTREDLIERVLLKNKRTNADNTKTVLEAELSAKATKIANEHPLPLPNMYSKFDLKIRNKVDFGRYFPNNSNITNFLKNLSQTPLPLDGPEFIKMNTITIIEPKVVPVPSIPKLNEIFVDSEPDKREIRFYDAKGSFDLTAYSLAADLYQSQKDQNGKNVESYTDNLIEHYKAKNFNATLVKDYEELCNQLKAKVASNKTTREIFVQYEDSYNNLKDMLGLQISGLNLANYFPNKQQIAFDQAGKILVIDFWLPAHTNISITKDNGKPVSQKEFKKNFDDFILQIALGIPHFLFRCDYKRYIEEIVFNGISEAANDSTGIVETKCILSIACNRNELMTYDLTKVDPTSCFKKLKGNAAKSFIDAIPVRPILKFENNQFKFIEADTVIERIEDQNLASIDWQDFETLVRDVFQKEFTGEGIEVKVTQASRDGGVDGVIIDPNPFRGGITILQAKRYTNVVDVSAVRDLYGVVIDKGANRGVLITTATYGKDSYEFAKGKPISLINGSEFLSLLKKHGYSAKIDLLAAKTLKLRKAS